jgi:hypothetical protein
MRKSALISGMLLFGTISCWLIAMYSAFGTVGGIVVVWIASSANIAETDDYAETAMFALFMTILFGSIGYWLGRTRLEILMSKHLSKKGGGSGTGSPKGEP